MDDADTPRYTVRVVAERVGVPTATLRSWSQRYGVGPSQHHPGRHRLYSDNDVAAVQHMHQLIGQGTSPRSAARVATGAVAPRRGDADALLSAAFELDLASLGRLLEAHLRHFGVVDTWDLLVRPAFAAIVSRQDEDGGCVDVEHALSWAVSRSLHAAPLMRRDASTALILACTAHEAHVLPLEALRAALAERGRGAVMLGADVPMAALTEAIGRVRPSARVVLWSHTPETADMEMVTAATAEADVVLGGTGWEAAGVDGAARVHSLREALEWCVGTR
ncbi:transcriptional regulator [Mycolicibacterium novocastrense]|uniref:MerR family transcriptional regulator n=1 Tax=Mycolicibacterium novocastrense TaxID=59813 RepID=UPI00074955DF|nr:MerR family transcriptional regulator [Mycolicibacterium novocastrense]KUH69463.1 transcriptional regulator [Mycolicibacterium novocastrense]KUH72979.1 transcriptional regulator [Mycolicibacterium novocastrense]KUH74857.1 transcriptional regulator [Mycolicibacterium novocastrense]